MTRNHGRWGRPARRWWSVGALATASSVVTMAALTPVAGAATVTTTPPAYRPPAIPSKAFSDRTGVTAKQVRIGNVSTLAFSLFTGAAVGTQAYAKYVNSKGGVNGRKLVVDSSDDGYSGAPNRQHTQADITTDFAQVGGFSLDDSYGETVLAANPQVPNVTVSLSSAATALPNSFAPAPASTGWQTGGLRYFKQKYPKLIKHAGALVADQPAAVDQWDNEKTVMQSMGYKVVYDPQFDITQKDFSQNVIQARNDGVKILFLEQMPFNYAGAVLQALHQQNYHPIVVLGTSTYDSQLTKAAGGAANIDGSYLLQNAALYLGEDANALPAVKTFLKWVQVAKPGWHADLYTLYGWLSAELFTQALRGAGKNPTRGSELQQLRKITSFNGGYLVGTANPAKKIPSSCIIVATYVNGKPKRTSADPPVSSSAHGYICKYPYAWVKS